MKIAFFWTWEFSRNILKTILEFENIDVPLIVSQPDKPVWRKKEMLHTPIKILAIEKNIKILQPEKLKTLSLTPLLIGDGDNKEDFYKILYDLNLDFIVVVAYWKIVPKKVLEAPKFWCINIHWSILPLYRWASPIQESIKNWDTKTWLTIMYMSKWMDKWNILKIKEIAINENDKTEDIFKKFEEIWPELLINTLNWILDWKIKWIKQDDSMATYCSKITKEDWKIDFSNSAKSIYNKFKAYSSWPWIYTYYKWKKMDITDCIYINPSTRSSFSPLLRGTKGDYDFSLLWGDIETGQIIKLENKNIWIICWEWILILKQIKLEWKKTMDINSFINWNKDFLDYKF